jgi:hypothetical protein
MAEIVSHPRNFSFKPIEENIACLFGQLNMDCYYCFICGMRSHISKNCDFEVLIGKKVCYVCFGNDHIRSECNASSHEIMKNVESLKLSDRNLRSIEIRLKNSHFMRILDGIVVSKDFHYDQIFIRSTKWSLMNLLFCKNVGETSDLKSCDDYVYDFVFNVCSSLTKPLFFQSIFNTYKYRENS